MKVTGIDEPLYLHHQLCHLYHLHHHLILHCRQHQKQMEHVPSEENEVDKLTQEKRRVCSYFFGGDYNLSLKLLTTLPPGYLANSC